MFRYFKFIFFLLLCLCLMYLHACKAKKNQHIQDNIASYQNYTKATINKIDLDGCSWVIILDNGKRLEPINLADEFKINNLNIWVQYKTYQGNSVCMIGEMITVLAIAKR